jgi:hypothetical protein
MKKKLYIELSFSDDWNEYEFDSNDIILDDSGIYDGIKNGVFVKLIDPIDEESIEDIITIGTINDKNDAVKIIEDQFLIIAKKDIL